MKKAYVLLLLLLLMAACGGDEITQDEQTPPPTATPTPTPTPTPEPEPEEPVVDVEVAMFEGENWSMVIAEGWIERAGSVPPTLLAPGWNDSQINVAEGIMTDESLENVVEEVIAMFAIMFEDFELINEVFFVLDGRNAAMIEFESQASGFHTIYQFFIEHGMIAYIITYLRADETDFLDDVTSMIDTFVIH